MRLIAQRTVLVLASLVALNGAGWAQEPAVRITIQNHRFQPAEVRIRAGAPATLLVRNADATAEEFESKQLRVEKVIPGNSEAVIQLRALQPGRYKFYGEYNEATAQGVLVVE